MLTTVNAHLVNIISFHQLRPIIQMCIQAGLEVRELITGMATVLNPPSEVKCQSLIAELCEIFNLCKLVKADIL